MKNRGYYVGRYETSINGNTVASKQGVYPYTASYENYTDWYGLYKIQKDYASNISGIKVKSSMITGGMYDGMLNWALYGNDKNKFLETTNGNHSNTLVTTGNKAYENDKINNIFDLEGNLREWTTEGDANKNGPFRISRGGSYEREKDVTYRHNEVPYHYAEDLGSRLMLYL